jgi:hypothetical protein
VGRDAILRPIANRPSGGLLPWIEESGLLMRREQGNVLRTSACQNPKRDMMKAPHEGASPAKRLFIARRPLGACLAKLPYTTSELSGGWGCAGINRHEVGDERGGKSSEPS